MLQAVLRLHSVAMVTFISIEKLSPFDSSSSSFFALFYFTFPFFFSSKLVVLLVLLVGWQAFQCVGRERLLAVAPR